MPEWKLDSKAIVITNTITTDQWNLEDSKSKGEIETSLNASASLIYLSINFNLFV